MAERWILIYIAPRILFRANFLLVFRHLEEGGEDPPSFGRCHPLFRGSLSLRREWFHESFVVDRLESRDTCNSIPSDFPRLCPIYRRR